MTSETPSVTVQIMIYGNKVSTLYFILSNYEHQESHKAMIKERLQRAFDESSNITSVRFVTTAGIPLLPVTIREPYPMIEEIKTILAQLGGHDFTVETTEIPRIDEDAAFMRLLKEVKKLP